MGRLARAGAAILVAIAATTFVLEGTALASPARCDEKVLLDWSDNGRVDGVYPLHCYEAAIRSMPTDLRDYTNASDAIERALAQATAKSGRTTDRIGGANAQISQVPASRAAAIPVPLLVLAGICLAVLAAGGFGWVARRQRARRGA
jgi:hypothetical protein